MRTSAIILTLLTIVGSGARSGIAADCAGGLACCDQCGRQVACVETICQVVCEVKRETKSCWCVECEEFCPLMPGCHSRCDECPPPPRCGNPKCVKKLVRKEYQVEVPIYRCVVRHLCPDCCNGGSTDSPRTVPNPPSAPATPAMPPAPPAPMPPRNPK